MARSLRYTAVALTELQAIYLWQTQAGSGTAARRKLRSIRAAIRRLKRYPCLFPPGNQPGSREMPCAGHLVVYEVTPDTGHNTTAGDVLILRIFGPGQSRP